MARSDSATAGHGFLQLLGLEGFFPWFYGPCVRYKVTILIPTSNTSSSALSTSMPGAGGEGTTWNQGLRRNVFAYSFLALPYVASLVKYPWLLHVTEVIVKKYWAGLSDSITMLSMLMSQQSGFKNAMGGTRVQCTVAGMAWGHTNPAWGWSSMEFHWVPAGQFPWILPSGKLSHSYGKSPCLMEKSTISMTIFNSYFDITRGYMIFIEVIFLLEITPIRTFSGPYVVGFFPSSAVMSSWGAAISSIRGSEQWQQASGALAQLQSDPHLGGRSRRRPVTAMEHGHG